MISEDVWARIMDERNAESQRLLCGHAGPVYGVSFCPDKTLLLSCSEDSTGERVISYSYQKRKNGLIIVGGGLREVS